jgi:hypothetical protein
MSGTDFRREPAEQAVTQPELAVFVDLARAQRVPTVRIDTSALVAAVAEHRASRIRWTAVGAVVAVAAAWLLWMAIDRRAWVQGAEATHDEAPRVLEGSRDSGETREVEPATSAKVIVDPSPAIETPAPAVVQAPVELPPEADDPKAATALDAAELARRAEKAMAARQRDEAITLLSMLVRRFPKAPQAKAALLDLGRLLRDDGRPDHARCAYRLLVDRWPSEAKAPEVTRVLASLGEGPACRGLKPQR